MEATKKLSLVVTKSIQSEDQQDHYGFYHLGQPNRSNTNQINIDIKEKDTIKLVFEDDFIWLATPDDFAEIIDLESQSRSGDGYATISRSTTVAVGQERGFSLKKALIGFGLMKASSVAASLIASEMEQKILDTEGLTKLEEDLKLTPIKKASLYSTKPVLLFLHGTGSCTHSSFAQVFDDQKLFKKLYTEYQGNICAFDHKTWSKSPLQNVLGLLEALPDKVELHIVTYSRGGLIGDLLCLLTQYADPVLSEDSLRDLIQGYELLEDHKTDKFDYSEELKSTFVALKKVLQQKTISVTRYVRVACPARGTTLLSKRLDYFFNIIMNLTGKLASKGALVSMNPILIAAVKRAFDGIQHFGEAVLRQRANVATLSGLEAMRPESPFMKWLNQFDVELENINLYVVSGDSQINTGFWRILKTIVAKLYYLQKNDFVVDTVSMYGGTKFHSSVQFYVQNRVIDHFRYFENDQVRELLSKVLGTDEKAYAPLKTFKKGDNASYYRDRGAALRRHEKRVNRSTISGSKPVIILLPGIMGSHLDKDDDPIWLNFGAIHMGKMQYLQSTAPVQSDYVVGSAYLKFCNHFAEQYDVITVPYDWRSSLSIAAAKLKNKIGEVLEQASGQQVVMVAHSMGGLVVKQLMIDEKAVYNKLAQRNNFRMVFLGTPWRGSYLVPYTLLGYGRNINVVSLIDAIHRKSELLDYFRKYEGFLQMLPQNTEDGGSDKFEDSSIWNKLKKIKPDNIGKPTNSDLTKISAHFKQAQKENFDDELSNAYYIAGLKNKTVSGINTEFRTWLGKRRLKFIKTKMGDGSVTWELGIPKQFKEAGGKDRLFYSKIEHGQLANEKGIFAALEDIFQNGTTSKLAKTEPRFRSDEIEIEEDGEESFVTDAFNFENDILGLSEPEEVNYSAPISVSMIAGDLRHASYPVMLGHFWRDGILNAEKALDNYLNAALSKKHRTGSYPQWVGDHYVYIDPEKSKDKLHGAVILGLGDAIKFNAIKLRSTVRSGAIEYIREMVRLKKLLNKPSGAGEKLGITALLVGSGYGNLQVAESVRSIVKGIQSANDYVTSEEEGSMIIDHVEIIELYVNKAEEAMYELCVMEDQEYDEYRIEMSPQELKEIQGTREEMPYKDKRTWWQPFIIESAKNEKTGQYEINYNTEIRAARAQTRQVLAKAQFLDDISSAFAVSSEWDKRLAKVMFEILIPNEFKAYVNNQNNLKLNLDDRTANYPWEMIHDRTTGQAPLCINAGLIRQLQTTSEERGVQASGGNKALIIGDPLLHGYISQLPGAKLEAEETHKLLSGSGAFDATALVNREYRDIIIELFSEEYRVLHLAAHGIVDKEKDQIGMVIGHGHILSAGDIRQMSRVPELVFINCCHLGQIDSTDNRYYQQRNILAASLSKQFIESGARAVIAAGWAIDDGAARVFAKTFYEEMIQGGEFHEAVRAARKQVYEEFPNTNTWGAYQCYGDPYYKLDLRHKTESGDQELSYYIPKEVSIQFKDVRARAASASRGDIGYIDELIERVERIVDAAQSKKLLTPRVREQLAFTYADLNLLPRAIQEVEQLMKEEKAFFSVRVLEQYTNWKVKQAIIDYAQDEDIDQAETYITISGAIGQLDQLIKAGKTAERLALMGSAYRRRSLVAKDEKAIDDLDKASEFYHKAYEHNGKKSYYHLSNWVLMELLIALNKKSKKRPGVHVIVEDKMFKDQILWLGELINKDTDKDFWTYSAEVHLKIINLLNESRLGKEVDYNNYENEITLIYRTAWNRSGTQKEKQGEIEHIRIIRAHTVDEELTAFLTELERKIEEQILV